MVSEGERDARWTGQAVGRIVGESLNVQDELSLKGALLANAVTREDGTFEDKSNAKVRAARVVKEDLYDNSINRAIGGQFKRATNNGDQVEKDENTDSY